MLRGREEVMCGREGLGGRGVWGERWVVVEGWGGRGLGRGSGLGGGRKGLGWREVVRCGRGSG